MDSCKAIVEAIRGALESEERRLKAASGAGALALDCTGYRNEDWIGCLLVTKSRTGLLNGS